MPCSYTSSVTTCSVTFKNEETGEFTFYDLKLTAGAPAKQGSLVLESAVRGNAASPRVLQRLRDSSFAAWCWSLQFTSFHVFFCPDLTLPSASAMTAVCWPRRHVGKGKREI